MKQQGARWGWIILCLIIFWPVGLALMIHKFAVDKSILMSGKTLGLSVVGWGLTALGCLGLLAEMESKDTFGICLALLFLAGGISLLYKVAQTKKTAAKYKQYIDLIINHNERSMDKIVSATGVPYNVVAKDLQNMINIGYLKDALINRDTREIIMKRGENEINMPDMPARQVATEMKSVRCPGCGANNVVVVGKVSECEYCGTPINA